MPTFDGPNKLIILDSPITNPVQDAVALYSRWKDWARTGDNAKFLPAFANSVGGQPTNPPERISAYVFVNNDLGWRIRPFEANGDTFLEGDLFPTDPGLPLFVPTVGIYNTSVRQLVSSKALQVETGVSGLTATESQQLNEVHGQIGRYLWIDQVGGVDGAGFQQDPFSVLTSLVTEASTSGLRFIKVMSDLTLDQNMIGYRFEGQSIPAIALAGFNINGSEFFGCVLSGSMLGEIKGANDCDLSAITGLRGTLNRCGISGVNTLSDGARVILNEGFSTVVTPASFSLSASTGSTDLIVKQFRGDLSVTDMGQATDTANIEMMSGKLTLDATNVDGAINVVGIGELDDQSGPGCSVNTDAFMNANDTTRLRKLSVNRLETDPTTGIITVYDDDDTTILYQGNIWENVLANQIYRGRGLERRDRLTYLP
ncbi:MAG: hypothetical protein QNJ81_02280 [Acidimicrobiia bacterium]|nr:hypothetical protein [Acidimicrobiia bacterium]